MRNQTETFYETLDRFYLEGDVDGAERYLNECAAHADNTGPSPMVLIDAYNELGSCYRNTGQYTRSLQVFEQAKELVQELFGDNCPEYASVLNNMAGTLRLMKEYDRAILLFQQALALCRQVGREHSYPYVNMLSNLSLTYREAGRLPPAIATLEQMLLLLESMPEHRSEVAVVCSNLTSLYYTNGDQDKARNYLFRALQEFERNSNEENEHYAPGLNSLAGFLYACGDYENALTLYRRSAKYIRRFYGETLEYALTYQNMRWVYEKMGQQDSAVLALRKAANVYTKLYGPENERTRMVTDDLNRLQNSCNARSHEVM